MLHAGLAANMLTAIGGVVPFYEAKSMPRFPLDVPYVKGLTLELKACVIVLFCIYVSCD